MKKLFQGLFFLFFAASISFAQETSPLPSPSPSPTPIKYDLPYPGMLPDHPLYKLKVLRDKVTLFLTRDPMKKASYHLLLADKRIYASKLLVDKGEISLAKETALKGENEYTLLVFLFKDVVKKPDKNLYDRLEKASLKHQEVLNQIVSKVNAKYKKDFETVIYFSQKNLDELKTIYKNY